MQIGMPFALIATVLPTNLSMWRLIFGDLSRKLAGDGGAMVSRKKERKSSGKDDVHETWFSCFYSRGVFRETLWAGTGSTIAQ